MLVYQRVNVNYNLQLPVSVVPEASEAYQTAMHDSCLGPRFRTAFGRRGWRWSQFIPLTWDFVRFWDSKGYNYEIITGNDEIIGL